jgi:hypothetical protein
MLLISLNACALLHSSITGVSLDCLSQESATNLGTTTHFACCQSSAQIKNGNDSSDPLQAPLCCIHLTHCRHCFHLGVATFCMLHNFYICTQKTAQQSCNHAPSGKYDHHVKSVHHRYINISQPPNNLVSPPHQ